MALFSGSFVKVRGNPHRGISCVNMYQNKKNRKVVAPYDGKKELMSSVLATFLMALTKYLTRNNLRGGVYLGLRFERIQFFMVEEALWQWGEYVEAACPHLSRPGSREGIESRSRPPATFSSEVLCPTVSPRLPHSRRQLRLGVQMLESKEEVAQPSLQPLAAVGLWTSHAICAQPSFKGSPSFTVLTVQKFEVSSESQVCEAL